MSAFNFVSLRQFFSWIFLTNQPPSRKTSYFCNRGRFSTLHRDPYSAQSPVATLIGSKILRIQYKNWKNSLNHTTDCPSVAWKTGKSHTQHEKGYLTFYTVIAMYVLCCRESFSLAWAEHRSGVEEDLVRLLYELELLVEGELSLLPIVDGDGVMPPKLKIETKLVILSMSIDLEATSSSSSSSSLRNGSSSLNTESSQSESKLSRRVFLGKMDWTASSV